MTGKKFWKMRKRKLKTSRKALGMTIGLTGNGCTHVTIVFGVLHIMSVLAVARCTTNAVAQICKILSHPSKCILICGRRGKGKGHHFMSRV